METSVQTRVKDGRAYALERGGDASKFIVTEARVRALAERWGVGRVLEPSAIRESLAKLADDMKGKERHGTPRGISHEEAAGENPELVFENTREEQKVVI